MATTENLERPARGEGVPLTVILVHVPHIEGCSTESERRAENIRATADARRELEHWLELCGSPATILPPAHVEMTFPIFSVTTDEATAARLKNPALRPKFVKSAGVPVALEPDSGITR